MKHAEEFYSALALRGKAVEMRVFVATDQPSVLYEIKSKYPSFVVIGNRRASREASSLGTRYGTSALENVMTDLYLLAESDSLICTFSSGFCRVAYELMQARHARSGNDATRKAVSIDAAYVYACVPFPPRRTLYKNSGATDKKTDRTQSGILIENKRDFRTQHRKIVSPRFKTLQTYSLACYAAFNETTQII
ncbi:hypothetical protein MTO96_012705 [Rhipicephalus appendiculatus]